MSGTISVPKPTPGIIQPLLPPAINNFSLQRTQGSCGRVETLGVGGEGLVVACLIRARDARGG
jgi:hypothetical protein